MAAPRSQQSHNIKFLDTNTGEVIVRTDVEYEDDMEIAFSPDEDQVTSLFVTICNIMHLEKCASFDLWPRKNVLFGRVALQACNDLVICTISHDYCKFSIGRIPQASNASFPYTFVGR